MVHAYRAPYDTPLEICPLTNGEPTISPTTFHPNRDGQRGFADVIAATNQDIFK